MISSKNQDLRMIQSVVKQESIILKQFKNINIQQVHITPKLLFKNLLAFQGFLVSFSNSIQDQEFEKKNFVFGEVSGFLMLLQQEIKE